MHSLAPVLFALMVLALPTTSWAQTPPPRSPASTANSFVVQPESDQPREEIGLGYFRLGLSVGQTRDVRLAVKNTAAEPLTVRADGVDAVQILDSGIDYAVLGTPSVAAGTWLKIAPLRLTLQPGETQRLTATIVVPAGTGVGDHVAGIAVQNEQVQGSGAGSSLQIDIHYRQVIAVLAAVPGQDTTAATVSGVSLEAAADGSSSTARVDMHNTGNVLVKGKGTLEISGGSGTIAPQAFTFGSVLPDAAARLPVQLPGLHLAAGSYTVRVSLVDDNGVPLTDWAGSAPFAAQAALESPTAVPNAFLAPVVPAAAAVQSAVPSVPVWALLAGVVVLVVAAVGAGIVLGRRPRAR